MSETYGPDAPIETHPETLRVLRGMQAETSKMAQMQLAEARRLQEVGNYAGAARCYVRFMDHEVRAQLIGAVFVDEEGGDDDGV